MASPMPQAEGSTETLDRMRRAAPELERRWFGTPLLVAGGVRELWQHQFDFDRHAWLFEKLLSINRRGVEDTELVSMAVAIDDAMLACIFDADPHGEIKRTFGSLDDIETVAEYEEYRIALAHQYQPTPTPRTERKVATRGSDQDRLLRELQKAKTPAQRAQVLVAFRRRVGLMADRVTKHDELTWLIARIEAGSDYASLHAAWHGVSKWTRDQVALYAHRRNHEIRVRLMLNRTAVLAACREALGTPAFSKRPTKFAERAACNMLRRFVEQLHGPRSWYANEPGKLVPKAGLNLALQIAEKYGVTLSENHFKGLRG